MTASIVSLLLAALVCYIIYYVLRMFTSGLLLQVSMLVLGLGFLFYALRTFQLIAV